MDETFNELTQKQLDGRLVVRDYDGEQGRVMCIYGDPQGLRSLGQKLIGLANLEQAKVPDSNCPPSEGMHIHVRIKPDRINSNALDIGRLDCKGDGTCGWFQG